MNFFWSLVLFLFSLFALTACTEHRSNPQTLRWHLSAEPDLLNPILTMDAYGSRIESFLYDSLLERDPKTLAFRPKLASRWEVSTDHLTFTFHLRRDVRWHDGTPLTAHDVVYSYERIQDPQIEAPQLRVYYKDVKSVTAHDDYTVQFVFKEPYFLALEFCSGLPVIPRHLHGKGAAFNESPYNRTPVGSGPYRFVRWDTGKKLVLTRNEEYYDKKPDIRTIEFIIIPDSSVALLALKKGLLDLMSLQAIQWVKQTESDKFKTHFNKLNYYTPGYRYLGWNMRDPLFSDKRVRQAMTRLVDRQTMINKLEFSLGKIVTGPFFALGPDYNTSIPPVPYDPEGARRLLQEAGWTDHDGDAILDKDGRKFEFTFLFPSAAKSTERMATILKENLAQMGITMRIEQMEWAVFLDHINKRDFQATGLAWSMGFENDPYQVWHSSQTQKGSNFVGFSNPEVDHLIETARREFDVPKRRALFHRIHQIIHEEQPYTFLYTSPSLIAVDNRFGNVNIYPGGLDMLEWIITAQ